MSPLFTVIFNKFVTVPCCYELLLSLNIVGRNQLQRTLMHIVNYCKT